MIVVIGCSMVDTDFHLSGMLGHAVRERKRIGHLFDYAVLVDKVRIRRKWAKLLSGSTRHSVGYKDFAKFIRKVGRPGHDKQNG